jgi:hypothetical protein
MDVKRLEDNFGKPLDALYESPPEGIEEESRERAMRAKQRRLRDSANYDIPKGDDLA